MLTIYIGKDYHFLNNIEEKNKNKLIQCALRKETFYIKTKDQDIVLNPQNWDFFTFEEMESKENENL